jgi:hypothetical protein
MAQNQQELRIPQEKWLAYTSYIKQMPRITMYMFVLRTPLGAREFPNFSD